MLALLGKLRQRGRDVSGTHRLEHRQQPLGALPVGEREPGDRPPRQHLHRLAPAEAVAADAHGEAPDHPVPGAGRLDRGVDDHGLLAALDEPDVRVEQLADQETLVGALREATQADRARREGDGAGVDRGDAQHGHEDAPPGGELDHHAEHPRRVRVDTQ